MCGFWPMHSDVLVPVDQRNFPGKQLTLRLLIFCGKKLVEHIRFKFSPFIFIVAEINLQSAKINLIYIN